MSAAGWRAALTVFGVLLVCATAAAQSFEVVVDFGMPEGRQPRGGLVEGPDGCLYGTTVAGGVGDGTIFRFCSGVNTTIVAFGDPTTGSYPEAALMRGSDDLLYGTTRMGGASNAGTIFRLNPATGQLTTLHVFNSANGAQPTAELTEGADGRLYGVTSMGGSANKGTAFAIQKSGAGFTSLRAFTGANGRGPSGKLLQASDGFLYGTTAYGGALDKGTIFRMGSTGLLSTLVSFNGTNGSTPFAGLIQGTDGYLYGTTGGGGAGMQGTAFRMDPGGSFTVLRSFTGPDGATPRAELIQGSDGLFYGTTMFGGSGSGVVFKMSPTGNVTVLRALALTDGARPEASLFQASNGRFYATTPNNGPSGAAGTVFEITAAGAFTRLYAFSGAPAIPFGQLLAHPNGSLYGTSSTGGAASAGTIFKLTPDVSFEVMHGFSGPINGSGAYDGLVLGSDGWLYGTAPKGGPSMVGTVYKLHPNGTFTLLASASATNNVGFYPYASVVQAPDGAFYGVMSAGGAASAGTIYKISATGGMTLAHAFNGTSHGKTPHGRLAVGSDGVLYGTTSGGGTYQMGTLFGYDPAAKTFSVLHAFSGAGGTNPFGALIEGTDQRLYGTTFAGGQYGYGTIFAFDPATKKLTTLHSFNLAGGAYPYAGLFEAADGRLYGTTNGGGSSHLGTVFSISKTGAGYTVLHSFKGANGSSPRGSLTQGEDSYLYGVTPTGGSTNSGVIYRIAPGSGGGSLPDAPSNLVATAVSARVDLTWSDNSNDEQEFQIERCQGGTCSNFAPLAKNPAGDETFSDTTVAAGTTYRYRVRAANAAGASAFSNTASVTAGGSTASVTVTVPNTSVNWGIGTTQTIKWKHNGGKGSTVRIQLSRDGGGSWADIAASVANSSATAGSYNWVVTAPATSQARIRVAFTNDSASDISDANFKIAQPFVRVTWPNTASSVIKAGTTVTIKWASNLGRLENLKVELSKDGGLTYPIVMLASTPADVGQAVTIAGSWKTPTAKVRVTWLQNPTVTDQSNQSFAIK